MNYIPAKISKDPKVLQSFKESLNQLKVSLYAYDTQSTGFRSDIIGNEFRKCLEAFVKVAHSQASTHKSNLYDDLLHLTSDQELERQEYLSEGDKGFIKALLKFVHALGNYGSHYQTEAHKQIDSEHITIGRVAFYLLIKTYLSKHLNQDDYAFLKVTDSVRLGEQEHAEEPSISNQISHDEIEKSKRAQLIRTTGLVLVLTLLVTVFIMFILPPSRLPYQVNLESEHIAEPLATYSKGFMPIKQVSIAQSQKLKIILEHNLDTKQLEGAQQAAQAYANYRLGLEERNSAQAFLSIAPMMRCYYGKAHWPRHELLRSKRWTDPPPDRKSVKNIFLRAERSLIQDDWIQLSVGEQAQIEFGTGQIFVLEKFQSKAPNSPPQQQKAYKSSEYNYTWLITAEYNPKFWQCAPRVKNKQLYWPKE